MHEGSTATGDDPLFDRRAGGRDGVLEPVLALLELNLGGGTHLDDTHATGELRDPLLQLLGVPVGVGVLDLGAELARPGPRWPGACRRHRRSWSCPW